MKFGARTRTRHSDSKTRGKTMFCTDLNGRSFGRKVKNIPIYATRPHSMGNEGCFIVSIIDIISYFLFLNKSLLDIKIIIYLECA